MELMIATGSSS